MQLAFAPQLDSSVFFLFLPTFPTAVALPAGVPPHLLVSSSFAPVGGEARIKVVGVGGGGGNALTRMIETNMQARCADFLLRSLQFVV